MDLSDRQSRLVLAGTAAGAAACWLWWRQGAASAPRTTAGGFAATSFDAYLRNAEVGRRPAAQPQKPKFAPTSFEAYLRQPTPAAAPAAEQPATDAASGGGSAAAPPAAKPITVLYGTEYGFSKEVAERACERLRSAAGGAYWPTLLDMADLAAGLPGLGNGSSPHQALLLVCSTQGDGVPPTEAREFCDWLASTAAPALGGTPFSVCALGDKSYQHFCRCGRTLDARLEALGGARLAPRADINKEDFKAIDAWIESVLAALVHLPLKAVAELGGGGGAAGAALAHGAHGAHAKRWGKSRPYMGRVVALEALCTLASSDDKNTWRVEVDLGDSGLQYTPGDALGIWPTNCPQAVDELLAELGADGGLLVKVPSWHYADPLLPAGATSMPLSDALARCYDLRQPKLDLLSLLHTKLQAAAAAQQQQPAANGHAAARNGAAAHSSENGIGNGAVANGTAAHGAANGGAANGVANGIAANGTVNGGAANGTSASSKRGKKKQQQGGSGDAAAAVQDELCSQGCVVDALERLAALVADPTQAEQYLEPRHVIDVLRDFRPAAARLGVTELLATLRQLQPRLYSISSSQLEHPTRVQATVAVVRYSSLGADRLGVCSTYLAERLGAGGELPVYVHKNPDFRLPADPATPIIMVGPGTGLAPFRSFMQERLLREKESGTRFGQSVLFFGCRRRDQDFLYGPLLEGWAADGKVTLFTAFSREQAHKVYVQDRLAESSELVWGLLQSGAHFYVCGDAGSMAGAVEKRLLQIIQRGLEAGGEGQGQGQGGGAAAAAAYLQRLSETGRYQRDVWLS